MGRLRDPHALIFFGLTLGAAYAIGLPLAAVSHELAAGGLHGAAAVALWTPALAALLLTSLQGGRRGVARLLRGLARWRVRRRWYAAALLIPFAINVSALAADAALGGVVKPIPAPLPQDFSAPSLSVPLKYALLPVFLLAASLGEEIGWRGYALPRLQERHGALAASLVIGLVWAVWHVPLFLAAGSAQSLIPFAWFVPHILAGSVLFTWLYAGTGGSLLLVTLFHAAMQTANLVIPVLPSERGGSQPYGLAVVLTILLAATIVGRRPRRWNCRVPTKSSKPEGREQCASLCLRQP